MTTTPSAPLASTRPLSIATVLVFMGLVAMASGWFLPWSSRVDVSGAGPTAPELERLIDSRTNAGVSPDVVEIAKRLRDNGSASGRDLLAVGSYWVDHTGSNSPRERRAWKIGLLAATVAPFVAAFLAILVLLGRFLKPSFPVLALVLAYALGIAGLAALLGLGASERARSAVADDPTVLGFGIYAIAGGCLVTLFGTLFSFRASTWWKALLLGFALVAGAVGAVVAVVKVA